MKVRKTHRLLCNYMGSWFGARVNYGELLTVGRPLLGRMLNRSTGRAHLPVTRFKDTCRQRRDYAEEGFHMPGCKSLHPTRTSEVIYALDVLPELLQTYGSEGSVAVHSPRPGPSQVEVANRFRLATLSLRSVEFSLTKALPPRLGQSCTLCHHLLDVLVLQTLYRHKDYQRLDDQLATAAEMMASHIWLVDHVENFEATLANNAHACTFQDSMSANANATPRRKASTCRPP